MAVGQRDEHHEAGLAFDQCGFGASPGIGKTTLARQLATEGEHLGRVDHFNEEDILVRSEFEPAAL
jgi:hypothetical protein